MNCPRCPKNVEVYQDVFGATRIRSHQRQTGICPASNQRLEDDEEIPDAAIPGGPA